MEWVSPEKLAEVAAEARERWNVPGLAVGVLRDGEIVTAADGQQELGRPERVTPETVFRIASITKPFTATLAMTLVQEGLLALDEPPPGTHIEATVRQLLSHQAGLAAEWPEPLGLASTGFEAADPARGHEQVEPGADDHAPAGTWYPPGRTASGGLWSSVPDLLRFAQHHLGAAGPLTPSSVAEMQRACSSGPGFRYGLGWFLKGRQGHNAVEHPGSVLGFQLLLTLVPQERVAFASLTNSSRGFAAIRDMLREIGLGDDEPPIVESADLARLAGRYRGQESVVELTPEDGVLRVERTEIDPFSQEATVLPTVRARPIGESEFEIVDGEWRGEQFDFPRPGFVCMDLRLLKAE